MSGPPLIPLRVKTLRELFAHQQWLGSNHDYGRRLCKAGRFAESNFDGVNFSHAVIPRANFTFSSLRKSSFQNADLQQADFRWANVDNTTDFSNANLRGARFSQDALRKARFDGADLQGVLVLLDDLPRELEDPGSDLSQQYEAFCIRERDYWPSDGTIYRWFHIYGHHREKLASAVLSEAAPVPDTLA